MSTEMNEDWKFFNIAGGEYSYLVDDTRTTVVSDYLPAAEAAQKGFDSTVAKLWGDDSFI